MSDLSKIDLLWDDAPVDITQEANFIWSIANKLRGSYMPDKYGDVIIPMTIIRRFECALAPTKAEVLAKLSQDPTCPPKFITSKITKYPFYNSSEFSLAELCNDPDHVAANFQEYLDGFSDNVQDILHELAMSDHIKKMEKDNCLYSVIKAFSELNLSVDKFDSIKMGYIFENLIGRFYQNVDAGQFYTGRDIIKLLVSLLMAEGCDDLFIERKAVTVCDQACGTGGMLSTAYSYIRHLNPSADVRLFGQELMGQSYAVGLAEMLIKGQNAEYFRHANTLKEDCFPDRKMRFLIENPPFGTPWSGADAKDGQEEAVKREYTRGFAGRWGAGLPSGGDSQLLFIQSAVAKMDDERGRAAIISNGSPLFSGSTSSGESQIRRWLLEQDLIEAIIAMPTELFYNTGIATFIWLLSKNKRSERKGKIQLIDATGIYHKLRKPLGNKRNEFTPEDRAQITQVYADFAESDISKIYNNTDFIYREYTVMQPLQRSYGFSSERIENMLQSGALKSLWDESKVSEIEEKGSAATAKEQQIVAEFNQTKPMYEAILSKLQAANTEYGFTQSEYNVATNTTATNSAFADIANQSRKPETKWLSPAAFEPVLMQVLGATVTDKKLFEKIMDGLSVMDKEAEVQREVKGKNNGSIIYDKSTKDTEIVKWDESIEDYMQREVLPYLPDTQWFWEENLSAKKPVIKTGAEIPFTRCFYKYQQLATSEELAQRFVELENSVNARIQSLFSRTINSK